MVRKTSVIIICLAIIGCASRTQPAPIENMTSIPGYVQPSPAPAPIPAPVTSVASKTPPTQMSALTDNRGNSTIVKPVASTTTVRSHKVTPNSTPAATNINSNILTSRGNGEWMVPTAGKTEGYVSGNKGIDIYGTEGQSIVAINDGKVVYSGNGLKGYGNLIIIKHNDSYLSAYAHNKVNLVKEGATVKRGQQIATMGTDDSGKAMLHLEVRKNGKPVDPFTVIKK